MLNSLIKSLLNQNIYLFFLGMLLVLGVGFRFSIENKISTKKDLLFLFGWVLFAKIPLILTNTVVNPDESQVLSQALTIWRDPAMYRSFDGNTSGPINSYAAAVMHLLGFTLDYSTVHLLMSIFQGIILCLSYLSFRQVIGKAVAFICLLPFAAMFLLSTHYDFNHFSSELIALSIIIFIVYLALRVKNNNNVSVTYLFIAGFLGVALLLCKLQAAPMGFLAMLYLMFVLFKTKRKNFIYSAAIILSGGFFFVALLLSILLFWGTLDDFWKFYIHGNFVHSNNTQISTFEYIINYFLATSDSIEILSFILLVLGSIVVLVYYKSMGYVKDFWETSFVFGILYLLISLYAIGKSGFPFYHYMYFIFFGFSLLSSIFFSRIRTNIHRNLLILLILIPFMPYILAYGIKKQSYQYKFQSLKMPLSAVSKEILKFSYPTDLLVVWGWQIEYYVETQLAQGTADNHSIRCFEFSLTNEHRIRYIENMTRNKPRIFVDAIAPSSFYMKDRKIYGLSNFPELKRIIDTNYKLVSTVNDNRIYVKK